MLRREGLRRDVEAAVKRAHAHALASAKAGAAHASCEEDVACLRLVAAAAEMPGTAGVPASDVPATVRDVRAALLVRLVAEANIAFRRVLGDDAGDVLDVPDIEP